MRGLSARNGPTARISPKTHVRRSSRSGAERPIASANRQASRTAVHARHAAHKATTQRDGRAASLCCTGRRRDRGPVQIVLLRLALLARVAFRAHLTQPQLSQQLVDLSGEFARQVRARVLVRQGGHVDQQPGVSPAQLHLGGVEQAEQKIPKNLDDGKRAQPPHIFAGVLRRLLVCLLGAARPGSAHDSDPPNLASGWPTMLPAPVTPGCTADYRNHAPADAGCRIDRGQRGTRTTGWLGCRFPDWCPWAAIWLLSPKR